MYSTVSNLGKERALLCMQWLNARFPLFNEAEGNLGNWEWKDNMLVQSDFEQKREREVEISFIESA